MPDIVEQLANLRAHERRVAMATLVDARVVEHGERLLRENRAERVTVSVDDAEAIELGLTCGAEFDLLIEPTSLRENDAAVSAYESAARISRSGHTAYIVKTMTRSPA